ncbi:WG repeat-containing protein [Halarcobacter ebronensis]|uniref:Type IV secretion system putative lipoprotein virB7 n=1 Tax=Halarcobacter ebronensis TaxID=1462615 RepID=A0A4Q1AQW0_9BACT|nr:WG repeat-containing protein [Halarcobacter ebronensis]QKF83216.1 WG_beta_rep domain-containing protein [Halarcobacter ebronensis]RXK05147.1 hypothetical protein CRV07_09025 [Halarcobacter ebronensis]
MKKYLMGISIVLALAGCTTNNAVVVVGDKEGLLDKNGNVLIKAIYEKIDIFDLDGTMYAIVKDIGNKYGITDLNGNIKLDIKFDSIGRYINGFAKVEVGDKYGLINKNFELVLEPIYEDIRTVIDNSIVVKKELEENKVKFGCFNTNIEEIAPLEYDMIYLSSENRMRVKRENLWGFMDTSCKLIVEPKYSFVKDYSNGLAKVIGTNGLVTYIDLQGEEIERKTFNEGLNF